jgi:hypothetical protein
MRALILIAGGLALGSGCWGSPVASTTECDQYVTWIRALDADAGQSTNLDRYVEGGACWNNPTLAEGCTTACARALTRLQARETSLPEECGR